MQTTSAHTGTFSRRDPWTAVALREHGRRQMSAAWLAFGIHSSSVWWWLAVATRVTSPRDNRGMSARSFEIAIDVTDPALLRPFWMSALGYVEQVTAGGPLTSLPQRAEDPRCGFNACRRARRPRTGPTSIFESTGARHAR